MDGVASFSSFIDEELQMGSFPKREPTQTPPSSSTPQATPPSPPHPSPIPSIDAESIVDALKDTLKQQTTDLRNSNNDLFSRRFDMQKDELKSTIEKLITSQNESYSLFTMKLSLSFGNFCSYIENFVQQGMDKGWDFVEKKMRVNAAGLLQSVNESLLLLANGITQLQQENATLQTRLSAIEQALSQLLPNIIDDAKKGEKKKKRRDDDDDDDDEDDDEDMPISKRITRSKAAAIQKRPAAPERQREATGTSQREEGRKRKAVLVEDEEEAETEAPLKKKSKSVQTSSVSGSGLGMIPQERLATSSREERADEARAEMDRILKAVKA